MIRPSDHRLELWDTEFLEYADYLVNVIGTPTANNILRQGAKSIKPHFWYTSLKAVRKWKNQGCDARRIGESSTLVHFGVKAMQVKVFQADWDQPGSRDLFLHRLRNSKEVEGLLFELQAGTHFLRQACEVEYTGVSQTGTKLGDLVVQLGEHRAILECTCRDPSYRRRLWDKMMAEDMLKSASKKLESSHDYGVSRLVAIRVPEPVRWNSVELRANLNLKVREWAGQGRLESTNCIYFMGAELPRFVALRRPGSKGYWSTSGTVFFFRNETHCRYDLPPALANVLTMSEPT